MLRWRGSKIRIYTANHTPLGILTLRVAHYLIARLLGQMMMRLDGLGLAVEAAQVARVRVVERLSAAVADVGRLPVWMLTDGMRQLAFVSMAI